MLIAEFLCKICYIKACANHKLQVGKHALDAMHWGNERVNKNSEKLMRDQDFVSMGWT